MYVSVYPQGGSGGPGDQFRDLQVHGLLQPYAVLLRAHSLLGKSRSRRLQMLIKITGLVLKVPQSITSICRYRYVCVSYIHRIKLQCRLI